MVQDTPSYAAAATSPSRGPAGVDAEMTSRTNAAAYDLESDPGFVRNCARMSAFGWEYRHLNNTMPGRPLTRHQRTRKGILSGASKHGYTCTWC